MNRYAYVGNDPLNFVDPTGEFGVASQAFSLVLSVALNGPESAIQNYAHQTYCASAGADCGIEPVNEVWGVMLGLGPGRSLGVAKGTASFAEIKTVLASAQEAYKGSTVVGHALSKHAGRHPEIWGKMTGSMKTWNDQAMMHLRDIVRGPGEFQSVSQNGINFLEKRLILLCHIYSRATSERR